MIGYFDWWRRASLPGICHFDLWSPQGFTLGWHKIALSGLKMSFQPQGEILTYNPKWSTFVHKGCDTMSERTFTAVIHKEDKLFVAECPEVGTVSQGHTLDEAVANLQEATELYLEEFPPPVNVRSFLTTFEVKYG
jgi:predicted RNase H-like HicB family nuclease